MFLIKIKYGSTKNIYKLKDNFVIMATDSNFSKGNDYLNKALKHKDLQSEESLSLFNRANTFLSTAIELGNKEASTYNNRAIAVSKLGQYENALRDYSIAIELNGKNPAIYRNRGNDFINWGELDKAIEDLTIAISLDSNSKRGYNSRGLAYLFQGRFKEAENDFSEAIKLDPNFSAAYNNRGYARTKLDWLNGAKEDLDKAIDLNLDYGMCFNSRAFWFKLQDQTEQALADSKISVKLDPTNPVILADSAEIHIINGDKQAGKKQYLGALKYFEKKFSSRGSLLPHEIVHAHKAAKGLSDLEIEIQQIFSDLAEQKGLLTEEKLNLYWN